MSQPRTNTLRQAASYDDSSLRSYSNFIAPIWLHSGSVCTPMLAASVLFFITGPPTPPIHLPSHPPAAKHLTIAIHVRSRKICSFLHFRDKHVTRAFGILWHSKALKPSGISTDFTCILRHLFETAGFFWEPTFKHHVIRKNNAGLARSSASVFSLKK